MSFFQGALGRDAMYFFRIKWNGKALRADDKILIGEQTAFFVVQLPSQLYQPGPIVKVRHGRIVRPG